LENQRRLPAYVTVTTTEHGRGTETMRRFVRNNGTPVQFIREERIVELPRIAARKLVLVQNNDGLWHQHDKANIRLLFPLRIEHPIPQRLLTAQVVCGNNRIPYNETKHLACAIERGIDHFGIVATRITVSIAPELLPLAATAQRERTEAADEATENSRVNRLPATYVYLIACDTPFILSWQSYDHAGAKLADVTYREVNFVSNLGDELFQIPEGRKVYLAANRDEYNALLAGLGPPAKR
jgi:hypothetical protein